MPRKNAGSLAKPAGIGKRASRQQKKEAASQDLQREDVQESQNLIDGGEDESIGDLEYCVDNNAPRNCSVRWEDSHALSEEDVGTQAGTNAQTIGTALFTQGSLVDRALMLVHTNDGQEQDIVSVELEELPQEVTEGINSETMTDKTLQCFKHYLPANRTAMHCHLLYLLEMSMTEERIETSRAMLLVLQRGLEKREMPPTDIAKKLRSFQANVLSNDSTFTRPGMTREERTMMEKRALERLQNKKHREKVVNAPGNAKDSQQSLPSPVQPVRESSKFKTMNSTADSEVVFNYDAKTKTQTPGLREQTPGLREQKRKPRDQQDSEDVVPSSMDLHDRPKRVKKSEEAMWKQVEDSLHPKNWKHEREASEAYMLRKMYSFTRNFAAEQLDLHRGVRKSIADMKTKFQQLENKFSTLSSQVSDLQAHVQRETATAKEMSTGHTAAVNHLAAKIKAQSGNTESNKEEDFVRDSMKKTVHEAKKQMLTDFEQRKRAFLQTFKLTSEEHYHLYDFPLRTVADVRNFAKDKNAQRAFTVQLDFNTQNHNKAVANLMRSLFGYYTRLTHQMYFRGQRYINTEDKFVCPDELQRFLENLLCAWFPECSENTFTPLIKKWSRQQHNTMKRDRHIACKAKMYKRGEPESQESQDESSTTEVTPSEEASESLSEKRARDQDKLANESRSDLDQEECTGGENTDTDRDKEENKDIAPARAGEKEKHTDIAPRGEKEKKTHTVNERNVTRSGSMFTDTDYAFYNALLEPNKTKRGKVSTIDKENEKEESEEDIDTDEDMFTQMYPKTI